MARHEGQVEEKHRSAARLRLEIYRAMHAFDERARDREAQAGARFAARIGPVRLAELLEDVLTEFHRDSRPRIAYADAYMRRCELRDDLDRRAARRKLRRVRQQIRHHLKEAIGVD